MNEQEKGLIVQRILVALDTSYHSLAALRAAVELASSLEAELRGIFVEDINLLRAAGLPGAQEVQYPFDAVARMDQARMERLLRAQAEQARRALVKACEKEKITWSFRVARGDVASKVLEAAKEVDLLSIGRASRPLISRAQTGSTARKVTVQASRSVLLLPRDARIRAPIVALYDESPTGQQALKLAGRLAREYGKYLSILSFDEAEKAVERLQDQAADWLQGLEMVMMRYRQLSGTGLSALNEAFEEETPGILILSDNVLNPEETQKLLDDVKCPVLVIR